MKFKNFVGVDVSKNTLDFSVIKNQDFAFHCRIENTLEAIKKILKELKSTHKIGGKSTLFCLEHVGIYSNKLVSSLLRAKSVVWLETPLRIKLSLGLQRGKNDKIDSLRIAQYCQQNYHKAIIWNEPREIIQKLKHLSTLRLRLWRFLKGLQAPLRDINTDDKRLSYIKTYCSQSIQSIRSDIKTIEDYMFLLINNDERLSHLFNILISIDGVGKILAAQLLVVTNEFKNFHSAKKFACYCGIAPFEHSSGSNSKGKSRVSMVANLKMKTLLHLPTLAAIKTKGDLQDYYKRKVAEGHPALSVINAAKNKLVQRIFACIKQDRLYRKINSTVP